MKRTVSYIQNRGETVEHFREIYESNVKEVYGFLLSLTRDEQLAEELTQETFVRAMEHIDSFRGDCKISVWLCQIGKNLFYRHHNKNRTRADMDEATVNEILQEESPEGDVLQRHQSSQIQKYLHGLEEPYKEVFMLHIFGEVSLKEISLLFGKSDSWARVTFYRAKAAIIEKLKGDSHEL
ncbi:MAG: sigma-70 family RNA polymerase sigma factor [Clostridia bacterium]|nr:sigma-70 family RNA polymerase sigma factor [Clostridia bacterium]